MFHGRRKARFRTVGYDIEEARAERSLWRVSLKTAAAYRDIPLAPQLVARLREYRRTMPPVGEEAWMFLGSTTVPGPGCASNDLRHTFASHLILDLRLDVAQVSRILGHAQVSTTLNVYTHLFDEVRHSHEVRRLLAGSAFAGLLGVDEDDDVITLPPPDPSGARRPSARERAATRWGIGTEAHPRSYVGGFAW